MASEPTNEEQCYREIQTVTLSSLAILAARLGSHEEVGRLLRSEIENNPLFPKLSKRQRLSLWRYCRLILRQAYRVND